MTPPLAPGTGHSRRIFTDRYEGESFLDSRRLPSNDDALLHSKTVRHWDIAKCLDSAEQA